eukprot:GGOE01045426.1.p1 GENE.GGOE01045426.1~~GGOE01045426.1.p1  ORF type:complete len:406 (+),score=102.49 GGOE01045426.1:258-1475(+)
MAVLPTSSLHCCITMAPISDLSLEDALRRGGAVSGLEGDELETCLRSARGKVRRVRAAGPDSLTDNEIGAIFLYTCDTPLYRTLNQLLHQRNREELKPMFPYLKLLLTGLHKLPPLALTVFRGVKADLSVKYAEDSEVVWWSFTSTTATVGVLTNSLFLGSSGPRTMFTIQTSRAVNICKYTAYPEDERLLMPGLQFTVKSKLHTSDGLVVIQLEELQDEPTLLAGFAFVAPHTTSAQSLAIRGLLARVEDGRGWVQMRADLQRGTLDWAALVEYCRLHSDTDAQCQYVLGECRLTGEEVPMDEAEAVRLFRKAAEAGYPPAQCRLGVCYKNGQGVAQDAKAAVRLFQKAAEAGHADAQRNLGVCYDKGQGVVKDAREAQRWFQKAAEAGDGYSQSVLRLCNGGS